MSDPKFPICENPDEIFAIADREPFPVDVPEWGKTLMVQELDAATMAIIHKSTTDANGKIDNIEYSARVVLEGTVKPKFQPHHIEMLKKRSNTAFLRVFAAIHGGKKKEPSSS